LISHTSRHHRHCLITITMFILTHMKDKVSIPPRLFNVPLATAVKIELNKRLANRVVVGVGLCICLYDIVELGKSFIFHGEGSSNTEVHFRFVVFRPAIGEVIIGKLRSCSREGIHVSLGFFDDILIPEAYLPDQRRFDEREQLWVWEFLNEDGEQSDLFMEVGEKIRFQVKEEIFKDTWPQGPTTEQSAADTTRKVPYCIKGSVNESGLGLLSWWS